jgi:hypothetical protein
LAGFARLARFLERRAPTLKAKHATRSLHLSAADRLRRHADDRIGPRESGDGHRAESDEPDESN